jgi:hypothetical protein
VFALAKEQEIKETTLRRAAMAQPYADDRPTTLALAPRPDQLDPITLVGRSSTRRPYRSAM